MSIDSRKKGQRGEREVINEINKVFNVKYARTPLSGGLDIRGDIRRPFGGIKTICDNFHWEVKFKETINIWKDFQQSKNDSRKDPLRPTPILVFRKKNNKWNVIMEQNELSVLLEQLPTNILANVGFHNISEIKSIDIFKYMQESENLLSNKWVQVLVFKRKESDWMVALSLDNFLYILDKVSVVDSKIGASKSRNGSTKETSGLFPTSPCSSLVSPPSKKNKRLGSNDTKKCSGGNNVG